MASMKAGSWPRLGVGHVIVGSRELGLEKPTKEGKPNFSLDLIVSCEGCKNALERVLADVWE